MVTRYNGTNCMRSSHYLIKYAGFELSLGEKEYKMLPKGKRQQIYHIYNFDIKKVSISTNKGLCNN